MGLFSAIASIFGGGDKAKAAKQAADAQVAAAQQGIDAITGQQALTTQNLAPWLQTGGKALGAQGDLLGLNGNDAQGASIQALQDSPLFQSLFRTGQNTVLANGSATGGLRGGNIQNSLANFGSDTLAQVIQQQLANLQPISAAGNQTGLAEGQLGAQSAQDIANLYGQQGAARAGGIMGKLSGHLTQLGGVTSGLESLFGNFSPPGSAGGTPAPAAAGSGGSGGISSILSSLGKFLF